MVRVRFMIRVTVRIVVRVSVRVTSYGLRVTGGVMDWDGCRRYRDGRGRRGCHRLGWAEAIWGVRVWI